MHPNKKKNTARVAVSLFLITAVVIAGAFAYLSATDSKTNVFTIGNINLHVTEENWTNRGDGLFSRTDEKNLNIIPGQEVDKAPQVVNDGTNEAILYVSIGIPTATSEAVYANDDGNVAAINGEKTIQVQAYGIQKGYADKNIDALAWDAYFNAESNFGAYENTSDIELFKLINLDTDHWQQVAIKVDDDTFVNTYTVNGVNYYVYKYLGNTENTKGVAGYLGIGETTEAIFEKVQLNPEIGNTIYKEPGAVFWSDGTSLSWSELFDDKNATKYNYEKNAISENAIGLSAFMGCYNLEDIKIPYGCTLVDDYAFSWTGLTNITYPNTVTTIKSAMINCPNLETITLPSSLNSLGSNAIHGCDNLKSVTYKGVTYTDNISLTNALTANGVTLGLHAIQEFNSSPATSA